ncbi:MAG: hypothetical protein EZS28_040941, partial [Streblomastix strix]
MNKILHPPKGKAKAKTLQQTVRRFASCLLVAVLCSYVTIPTLAFADTTDTQAQGAGSLAPLDEGDEGQDPGTGGGIDPGTGGGTDPGTGGGTDPGTGGGTDPGTGGGTDPGTGGGTDPVTGGGTDPGTGGGTDPGTGGGTDPGAGGTTDPGTGGEDDRPVLRELDLLAYSTDATGNWLSELSRNMEGSGYRLNGGIGEKGKQIRLRVNASWDDGRMFKQGDPNWLDVGGNFSWRSSNSAIATVSSTGVVTAVGDGEVTITVTAPSGISAPFYITVFGQDGAFVSSVEITDETGEEYGTTYINITSLEEGSIQFYVRLYYSDDTTQCNAPAASDYAASFTAGNVSWSLDSTEVGYINVASGNFIPQHDGRTQLRTTVTGADPTKGGIASDSVFINVATGTYEDGYLPSSELKIKITYSENETLIAKEETL